MWHVAMVRPTLTEDENHIRLFIERHQDLLVRVVTWNQEAQMPPKPEQLQAKLLPKDKYHVYVIGTQVPPTALPTYGQTSHTSDLGGQAGSRAGASGVGEGLAWLTAGGLLAAGAGVVSL